MDRLQPFCATLILFLSLLIGSNGQVPVVNPPQLLVSNGQRSTFSCSASDFADEDQIHWRKLSIEGLNDFPGSAACIAPTSETPTVPITTPESTTSGSLQPGSGSGSGIFSGDGLQPGSGDGVTTSSMPTMMTTETPTLRPILLGGNRVANGSNITFDPIGFEDEGYYVCVVALPSGSCYSDIANITVSPEVNVTTSPDNILMLGDNVTFTCSALGGPDNMFQWQKDGQDLLGESQSIYVIGDVDDTDGGVYTCIASNAAGNDSMDITLYVHPYIVTQPEPDVLSFAGDIVVFTCDAMSFPSPSYIWEKLDDPGFESVGQNLTFLNVSFGFEGSYRCVAYITVDTMNYTTASDYGLLTISPEGSVTATPSTTNNVVGDNQMFICNALGGPGNVFTWTRLYDNVVVGNMSTLIVSVEGATDGGMYMCDVENNAGNDSDTVTLNVGPLIEIASVPTNVSTTETATLTCSASGFPIPTITWTHNGTEVLDGGRVQISVTSGDRSSNSTLTITSAMTNDSGDYVCIATSFLSAVNTTALLLVQNTPERPQNVTAVTVATTNIVLTWVEPHDNNAPILGYRISYNQPDFLGGGEMTVNSSVEMVNITGLRPGVSYSFTVIAFNNIGVGAPSDVEVVTTVEEVPSRAPQNVTAEVISSTEIRVSWAQVPDGDRNGIISTYEVLYEPAMTFGNLTPATVNTTNLSIIVSGLEEFVEYNISVRAYTSVGPGPYTEEVTERTFEDEPASPPTNISIDVLSSTEIRVSWAQVLEIDRNGIITTYEVLYEPLMTFGVLTPATVNTTNLSIIVSGLEEFVGYNISVRAYTSVGPGPYSEGIINRTLEDVPATPPRDVQALTLSPTEIQVLWMEDLPIDRNGLHVVHEIRYEPLMDYGGAIQTMTFNTTVVGNVTLTGLEEYTEYNISVRAYTSVGPGPYSEGITNRTFEDVPDSPPDSVMSSVLSSTEIRVSWAQVPEIDRNGIITTYEVLYEPLTLFGVLTPATVNTTNLSIIVSGLEEFVEYNISVRAYTSVGPGPYSVEISNTTMEDVPTSPPDSVMLSVLSSTEIRVSWNKVPEMDRNGIITTYEVLYEPLMTFDDVLTPAKVNTTNLSIIVSGLEEFVEYNISVRAYTSVGPGPYSEGIINRTMEDVPATPPRDVQALTLSPTEILVLWMEDLPIDRNGLHLVHEIRYEPLMAYGGAIQTMTVNTTVVGSVTLTGLEEYTEYNISVRAYTSAGPGPYSEDVTNRTFEDVPASPPDSVMSSVLSSTEIRVSWAQVPFIDRNGIITTYEVLYEPLMTFGVLTPATVNTTNLSIIVSGLEEFVEYNISVRAYTSVGPGPYSERITDETFEDAPAAAPRNLILQTNGPNSLNVSWERPPEIDINGILTVYSIEYFMSEMPNDPHSFVNVSGTTLNSILEDLNNYTVYNVSVSAFTEVGGGPSVDGVRRTDENVPGAPPNNVMVESESSTSIFVQWDRPIENLTFGILRSYRVRFGVAGQDSFIVTEVPATNTSLIIQSLMEFTTYSVEVTAVTVGEGPYSDPINVTTDQDVPGAVERPPEVPASAITAFTVTLAWDPPADPNGDVIQYTVNLFIVDATSTARRRRQTPTVMDPDCLLGGVDTVYRNFTVSGSPPSTSLAVNDLTPFTVYEFKVQAETNVGPGVFSPTRSFSTPEDVPTQTRNLTVMYLSPSVLEITWEFPQCDYGIRTGYIITHEAILGDVSPLGGQGTVGSPFMLRDSTATSLVISGLTSYTNYSITLCARTSAGCGEVSTVVGQTDEAAPNAVTNLEITSRNRTDSTSRVTVEFLWTPPSARNGPFKYNLVYRANQLPPYPNTRSTSVSAITLDLDGGLQSYIVTDDNGLPFADYTVDVFAYNIKRGLNVRSSLTSVTTKTIAIEPTEVTDIGAGTTSFQSILVLWKLPLYPNSEISHYVVYYTPSNTVQPPPISDTGYSMITTNTTQTASRRVEIMNLVPFTNYTIHIRTFGIFEGGLLSGAVMEEVLMRTNITNPSAIRNLDSVAMSPESIQVTWVPPVSPNGPISHYVVFYTEGDTAQPLGRIQSDGYSEQRSEDTQTSVVISGLIPYTNYTIHVQTVISEPPYTLTGAIDMEIVRRTNSTVPDTPPTANTNIPLPADPTHEFINILIPDPLQIKTGRVIFVAVVVVRNPPENLEKSTYLDAKPFGQVPTAGYYITAAWDEADVQARRVPSSGTYVVGDGSMRVVDGVQYINGQLDSDTAYAAFVRYNIASDNNTPLEAYSDQVVTRTALPYSQAGLAIGILIILIVIVVIVVLAVVFYIRYRRDRMKGFTPSAANPHGISLQESIKEREAAEPLSFSTVITNSLAQHTGTHDPVQVEQFSEHVKTLHCNDDYMFTEEYARVEPDQHPTTDATRRPENISKNRYANITSYDHSRVRLQIIPGVAGSDYINGNFIDGYRSTNAFIATQGPVPGSVPDFWRMVWEQGSATIVMVTNLEEKGRVKCHKYWPDERSDVQGDIRIQCQESLALADYTVRTFSLSKQDSKEERIIRQFHFTVWPDHGVPEYPSPLLHFVRKVMASNPTNAGPIVVHCSAGVGRTGTFITLFSQLKQIRVDNVVDIFGFVTAMRRRRCFMVQTEPQYIFIHDALLESIECGVTEVPARELREQYKRLGVLDPELSMTGLAIEYNKLHGTIHLHPSKSTSTLQTSKKKNRYANAEMLPYDKSRCRLSTIPGETGSDYINASHINGYHKRKAFLATQGPLPDTADDFWRMMWEQNCATIVMLIREREAGRVRCHRYWPESGAETYSYIQVILHAVNEYPDYILREFKMVDTRDGSSLPVKQFQYTGWPEEGVPDSGSGLIDLIGQVQKWQRSSGDKPVVVHCSGGTGRTGTFIAISILLERLKTEGVVDVFQAVRTLRLQRPGMVQTVHQYEFCYKTVLEFLESFELYSNFK